MKRHDITKTKTKTKTNENENNIAYQMKTIQHKNNKKRNMTTK